MAQMAARSNLKRVTLELGGKSPNIVFADADCKFIVLHFIIIIDIVTQCQANSHLTMCFRLSNEYLLNHSINFASILNPRLHYPRFEHETF